MVENKIKKEKIGEPVGNSPVLPHAQRDSFVVPVPLYPFHVAKKGKIGIVLKIAII